MKRLLIGSCIAALLIGAAPVMADDDRGNGHSSSFQKHSDRTPGHHKTPFLQADYRRDHHDRDRGYKYKHKHKNKHRGHKRDRDHYSRYDRDHHSRYHRDHHSRYDRGHYRDKHRHSHQRDRYHRHDRHHDHRGYRVHIGFDDHVPPEFRVARIIHNTRELIEPSHR